MDKAKTPAAAKAASTTAGAKKRRHARNWELGNTGLMRFSRATMYRRRAIYKRKRAPIAKKVEEKKPSFVEKQIGGDKNGGKRRVPIHRLPRYYPTEDAPKRLHNNKKPFSAHKHHLRASIKPGSVLIVLAGKQKGKVSLIFSAIRRICQSWSFLRHSIAVGFLLHTLLSLTQRSMISEIFVEFGIPNHFTRGSNQCPQNLTTF